MSGSEIKFVYFSWVRERTGVDEEMVELPENVNLVSDLLVWLQSRNEQFAAAFEFPDIIRVALDQEHVEHDAQIGTPNEIALFPPMTGG